MLGGAREVDHLPVGQVEIVTIGRVVEIPAPGAVAVPAPHRRPHGRRQGVDQDGHRPAGRREGVEVFDARADFGRVRSADGPAADPEQPHDPAREELHAPLGRGQRKGPQPNAAVAGRVVGGQLQVAAPEEPGDPAVRASEVEDEDARVVLQSLDEQEIERETLPRAGGPEDQRVADVAVKQVVVKRRLPLGFEDGERGPVQVPATRRSGRWAVDGRQARRRARRHEHGSDLPLAGLRRQSAKPRRELAVPFTDGLRVVRREDAKDIAVEAFGLCKVAVQGDRERQIAVRDPLRFQLHECIAQAPGFHVGRAIDHRRRGAFRLLYVGHHRVPLGEVMALCAAYLAARRVQIPRPPFERDGHHAVEAVQVIEEVRRGPGRRGHERVEDDGLAVQSQMPAFGFEFTGGEPPVHAAAGRPIPRRAAGLVHQLREDAGAGVRGEDVEGRQVGDERPAGVYLLPKPGRRVLDLLPEVDRLIRIPPALHPCLYVVLPPRLMVAALRRRREFRVVAPRDKGVDLLDARAEERAPLALPEGGDGRQAGIGVGEGRRPAQEVDVQPGPGVDA